MATSHIRDRLILSPVPMTPPDMDREDGPYCYFSRPTDVLGWMDAPEAAMLTPDGHTYAVNTGELVLFTGNPPAPLTKRIRSLLDGHLPVYDYHVDGDGTRADVRCFARPLGGDIARPLVCHVRVTLTNTAGEERWCQVAAGVRFRPPSNNPWGIGDNHHSDYIGSIPREHMYFHYQDKHFTVFNPQWRHALQGNAMMRDTSLIYAFSGAGPVEWADSLFPFIQGYKPWNNRFALLPDTPAGITLFGRVLGPGESLAVDFRMPASPIAHDSVHADAFRNADADTELRETVAFWRDQVGRTCGIRIPEAKVADAVRANLVFNCIAREKTAEGHSQRVNRFQYNAFWLRDASFMARAYEVLGRHDLAGEVIEHFFRYRREDGLFISQGGQYDGWGQVLWAFGQHYLMTRDREFALRAYPSVRGLMDWMAEARRRDVLSLVPETTPGDNENITGHITGHNFWAVLGMRMAAVLAGAAGERKDAERFAAELADFREALDARLEWLLPQTDNYIPPGLDGDGGEDWGNLLAAFMSETLPADHPAVERTMEVVRGKFREGIMTYFRGLFLHTYLTFRLSNTALMRGEQELAVEDLYNVLLHTGSTHTGFETRMVPWAGRDFGFNMAPHGWCGADLIVFIRNMLVREEGRSLHLLSAVSPAWVGPGLELGMDDAPTQFGRVTFLLREVARGRARLTCETSFAEEPEALVLHLPWFVRVTDATVDGAPVEVNGSGLRSLLLPSGGCTVELGWERDAGGLADVSFAGAVGRFTREWERRYAHWQRTGRTLPDEEYVLFPELRPAGESAAATTPGGKTE